MTEHRSGTGKVFIRDREVVVQVYEDIIIGETTV